MGEYEVSSLRSFASRNFADMQKILTRRVVRVKRRYYGDERSRIRMNFGFRLSGFNY